MRVHIALHVPDPPPALAHKGVAFEFDGTTVADLLEHLRRRFGRRLEDALYDESGALDPVIQIAVNGETWVRRDELDAPLEDGDEVSILAFLAGG